MTDYAGIVALLNTKSFCNCGPHLQGKCTPCRAADAIEALVKERDELRDVWHKQVDVASLYFNKSQAAEAEVAEWVKSENIWKQARDDIAKRCNEAEAEVLKWQNTAANYEHEHKMSLSQVAKLKEQQKADDEHALKTANALKVFVDENAKLKEALTKVQTAIHGTGNKTIGEMLDALAAVEHISRRALEGK